MYAFHLLLGHHGAFSLTPIFLLSLLGDGGGVALRHPGILRARSVSEGFGLNPR